MAVSVAIMGASCSGGPVPKVDAKLYAGNSKEDGISRHNPGQPFEDLKCADPRFDSYVCMSFTDFKRLVQTYINSCAKWKDGTNLVSAELQWEMMKP